MRSLGIAGKVLLGVLFLGLLGLRPALGQQIHRNAFESGKPAWVKGGFDAQYDEIIHVTTSQVWHDGQRSEYISLLAKPGNFIYYQYPTGRFPIGEEMSAGIWLKANRPGAQLMARIVLPNERDPNNLDNRLTTFIRGDIYRNAGRWQRLELGRGSQLAKQQQQLMQAQLKRSVNFTDAYIDALVLNVYAGPGSTEVWIDDLEIGPVIADPTPGQAGLTAAANTKPGPAPRPGARNTLVEFNGNQLSVGGKAHRLPRHSPNGHAAAHLARRRLQHRVFRPDGQPGPSPGSDRSGLLDRAAAQGPGRRRALGRRR